MGDRKGIGKRESGSSQRCGSAGAAWPQAPRLGCGWRATECGSRRRRAGGREEGTARSASARRAPTGGRAAAAGRGRCEVGGHLHRASRVAGGADATALAGEGDEALGGAGVAADAGEAVGWDAAAQIRRGSRPPGGSSHDHERTLRRRAAHAATGNVGAAALYGARNIVLGAFKVGGARLTTGGEYTPIIAQGARETGTSLIAGDTFATAVQRGGLKIASAGAARALFGSAWVRQVFPRMPVPFNVWVQQSGKDMWVDEVNDLAAKTARKLTEKGLRARFGSLAISPPRSPASRSTSVGLVDEVPIDQSILLHFGIVNMKNGIGQGWCARARQLTTTAVLAALPGSSSGPRSPTIQRARRGPCAHPPPRRIVSPERFRGRNVREPIDLVQGTLDLLVLRALAAGPRHGYDVARWIRETTDGTILVEDRALYVALHRSEDRDWVASEWGRSEHNRRARYYRLTRGGRKVLASKAAEFSAYTEAVFKVLRAM